MNKRQCNVIIFEILKELYAEVKARSARKNISMRVWLTRAIIEYIKKEDQYSLKK